MTYYKSQQLAISYLSARIGSFSNSFVGNSYLKVDMLSLINNQEILRTLGATPAL